MRVGVGLGVGVGVRVGVGVGVGVRVGVGEAVGVGVGMLTAANVEVYTISWGFLLVISTAKKASAPVGSVVVKGVWFSSSR